ncbi:hypothetical protein I552_7699 [Mycobacterium xenopi 3993]|nr:hypothetical protein I552_7699 [Mycobacterium xenopi 3993]
MSQLLQFLRDPLGSFQQMLSAFAANPLAALIAYGPFLFFVGAFAAYEVTSPIATYGPMLALAVALPIILGLGLNYLQSLIPPVEAAEVPGVVGAAPLTPAAQPSATISPVAAVARRWRAGADLDVRARIGVVGPRGRRRASRSRWIRLRGRRYRPGRRRRPDPARPRGSQDAGFRCARGSSGGTGTEPRGGPRPAPSSREAARARRCVHGHERRRRP